MSNKILTSHLGKYATSIAEASQELTKNQVLSRIWDLDHTVWKPEPEEITNRLGWLRIAEKMTENVGKIESFVNLVRKDGYTHALLLGMGGSSLAPEVFRKIFGVKSGFLDLAVLDSTHPETVLSHLRRLNLKQTLFIVSTKSGGTVETLSFFKFFYNQVVETVGEPEAGSHFVAITDPGSKLEKLGMELNFRDIFLNDPNIGGRYSVLSYFGLVPSSLLGVDISKLLDSAIQMSKNRKDAAYLGAILGTLANQGRDKLTFITSKAISSFGDWVEQLIAESTGKEGLGILPVVAEGLGKPEVYGNDRVFIYLKLGEDITLSTGIDALKEAGQPVVEVSLTDFYDLGAQFFLWEMATAVASYFLKINPFDQPNVESAKVLARRMVAEFSESGALPQKEALPLSAQRLNEFLSAAQPGDYVSIQAYIPPTVENKLALEEIRLGLRDQYKLATSLGFGPRFLHSTGQLHKGDAGNGLFIQFTTAPREDAAIPDNPGLSESSMSFGTLIIAQALGDGQALLDENRRFIRFHLSGEDLKKLPDLS